MQHLQNVIFGQTNSKGEVKSTHFTRSESRDNFAREYKVQSLGSLLQVIHSNLRSYKEHRRNTAFTSVRSCKQVAGLQKLTHALQMRDEK